MMTHLAGYFFCLFIGFSLGLIGGGGSILTIPMLVFFFGIDPVISTTYSLFIVGLTAISGSIDHYRMRSIDYKTVLLFGIPSVIILFIMRRWLLGLIPTTILRTDSWVLSKSLFIMIVFSITMLIAGWSMARGASYTHSPGRWNTISLDRARRRPARLASRLSGAYMRRAVWWVANGGSGGLSRPRRHP